MMNIITPSMTLASAQLPEWTASARLNTEHNNACVREFLDALSQVLLQDRQREPSGEIISLGFWLRSSNITKVLSDWHKGNIHNLQKPLGLVVHYAPKNVDTLFVYSWVCSLLMGNANIVRLSADNSDLQNTVLKHINSLFEQPAFEPLAKRNLFVTFPHHAEASRTVSQLADARVIWGGDDSVLNIRALPCKPRCRDISFSDRHSAALINGDSLTQDQLPRLAEKLWRDIYPYGQQACSSPKLVFWLGNTALCGALHDYLSELASQHAIHHKTVHQQVIGENQRMEHLVFEQLIAAQLPKNARHTFTTKHLGAFQFIGFSQAPTQTLLHNILNHHPGLNTLVEIQLQTLSAISDLLTMKTQTLSHFGFSDTDLTALIAPLDLQGVDRVVPVGEALSFDVTWDGFNLLTHLSRTLVVR